MVADAAGLDDPTELPVEGVFGVLLQYPGTHGVVHDHRALVEHLHAQGTLVAVAADLLALVLVTPPGEWGADVVVGAAQRFGVPMGYGGPHAGYFATRDEFRRSVPGRLVGVSVDSEGRPALRLALQTREQHIRREKATSNICTAQVLLANIAGMYAVYHGPDGLRAIAERVHGIAALLFRALGRADIEFTDYPFFDTVTARVRRRRRGHRSCARARSQPAPRRPRDGGRRVRRDEHGRHRGAGVRGDHRPRPVRSSTRATGTTTCSAAKGCAARLTSSRTRCSARITPRRRCCATSDGCRIATSRSTAP